MLCFHNLKLEIFLNHSFCVFFILEELLAAHGAAKVSAYVTHMVCFLNAHWSGSLTMMVSACRWIIWLLLKLPPEEHRVADSQLVMNFIFMFLGSVDIQVGLQTLVVQVCFRERRMSRLGFEFVDTWIACEFRGRMLILGQPFFVLAKYTWVAFECIELLYTIFYNQNFLYTLFMKRNQMGFHILLKNGENKPINLFGCEIWFSKNLEIQATWKTF